MDLFCSREEKRREEEAGKKSENNTAERVAHRLLLAHERRHRPRPLLSRFHIPVFRVKHIPQKGKRRKGDTGRRGREGRDEGRESVEKGETRGKETAAHPIWLWPYSPGVTTPVRVAGGHRLIVEAAHPGPGSCLRDTGM